MYYEIFVITTNVFCKNFYISIIIQFIKEFVSAKNVRMYEFGNISFYGFRCWQRRNLIEKCSERNQIIFHCKVKYIKKLCRSTSKRNRRNA